MRVALVSAFLAVIAGLLATEVLVVVAIRPRLADLARVGEEHARAVAVTARLTERVSALRREIVAASALDSLASIPPRASDRFVALERETSQLVPLAGTAVEKDGVAQLKMALEECADESASIDRAIAERDPVRIRMRLASLLDRVNFASIAADELVRLDARQVQSSVRQVRASLLWAAIGASAVTAIAALAAVMLLRHALGAVARYGGLLEAHSAEMGAFASRAAHELRTPLQTLVLALGALRCDAANAKALDRAQASSERLKTTIDELLEFSRSGASPVPGACARVGTALEEVVDELGPRAAEAGIAVERKVERAIEVAMAYGHLRTVLTNLVGNAVKYAANTAGARIAVTADADSRHASVTIADNGPGIAPEALPHVFEPLYRASSEVDGHGLGLATVKRLVEAHGGTIEIASDVGRGTTVVFRLPRC